MTRRVVMISAMQCLAFLWIVSSAFTGPLAQRPPDPSAEEQSVSDDGRIPLFFREDWYHEPTPSEGPIGQANVENPKLELKLYGDKPGRNPDSGIWINKTSPSDPPHSYSGTCRKPCALAFRHTSSYVDLTGLAKVRWRTKISHFRYLRPIVKLATGTWLVGDYAQGYTVDYLESEFSFADMRWLPLDIDQVLMTGNNTWVDSPDLSRVDEVGFVDLAPGSSSSHGSAARSNVDWIEVYGKPVPRTSSYFPSRNRKLLVIKIL